MARLEPGQLKMTTTRLLAALACGVVAIGLADIALQHAQACDNRAHFFYSLCK